MLILRNRFSMKIFFKQKKKEEENNTRVKSTYLNFIEKKEHLSPTSFF